MTWAFALEALISLMIVMAGVFTLVGSIGLVRLPDLMTRLHAPTKATTLGVGGALIASMLYFSFFRDALSAHELLIALFLFLAAPITAQLIAKVYLHRDANAAANLPPPEHSPGWATFVPPPDDAAPGGPTPAEDPPHSR